MVRERAVRPVLLLISVAALASVSAPAMGQTFDYARIGQGLGAGARALGMGGAFSAVSDDATAVLWNPAGAGELTKPTASVTYAPLSRLRWEHPARTDEVYRLSAYRATATSRPFEQASAALPFKLGARRVVGLVGYQRVVDMGYERDLSYTYGWPGDSAPAGTYPGSYEYDSNESGGLDVYSAGLSVKLGRVLALGVTADRWSGDALAKFNDRDEALGSVTIDQATIDQSYSGLGFRGGLVLSPNERLRLAAVVRAPFKMTHEWTSHTAFESDVLAVTQDATKDGSFDMPLAATVGAAYKPGTGLTLAGDFSWARWKDVVFAHSYTSAVTVKRYGQADEHTEQAGERRQTWPRYSDPETTDDGARQSDTLQGRLGVEYVIPMGKGLGLPLRLGGFLDRQLVQDELGDPVRLKGVTAGLGLRVPYAAIDLAWAYESGVRAFKSGSGDVKQSSQRLCLSATLRP